LSRDIDANSCYTEKSSEDILVEQSLSRVELDISTKTLLIEKPCVLLEIKQEDQNISQTHRVEKHLKIKNKSTLQINYRCLPSGKSYINLGRWVLFTFIFKCYEKMPFVLLVSCFYRMVFDPGGNSNKSTIIRLLSVTH